MPIGSSCARAVAILLLTCPALAGVPFLERKLPGAKRGEAATRWLARRGERLFLVTDDEFTEVSLADIAAKRNGWQ